MVSAPAEAIVRHEPFNFGELAVSFDATGPTVAGPQTRVAQATVEATAAAVREWTRFDGHGRYRPLPGARTLRPDWRVRCGDEAGLVAVLDAVYPLALRHCEQWQAGGLRVVTLNEVLARQSGRYDGASRIPSASRARAASVLCSRCVKTPLWRGDDIGEGGIPCPEPCSVLVSLCREAATWDREPPPKAAIDPTVPFAQFDVAGNEVREAYLRTRAEGDTRNVQGPSA